MKRRRAIRRLESSGLKDMIQKYSFDNYETPTMEHKKIKAKAFAEFARRYGVEELLDCLERNEQAGIVYHRNGIMGDYDEFDDLEKLIQFIKTGKR